MLIGAMALATFTSVGVLYYCQNLLLYPSWAQGARANIETPASMDLPYKHVLLTSKDGVDIEGYDVRNKDENSEATCLILCPNAGNIGYFISIMARFYHDMNMSVFIFSYRGYGKSQGYPTEDGLKLDADCVIEYLQNDSFHKNKKLVLYGRSLGGAVAVYIASKHSDLCSAVILENTFLNIRKVIPYFLPYLGSVLSRFCRDIWNSEQEILRCSVTASFLFLSGLKDEIVPPEHMEQLYRICPSRDKQFKTFPTGYHNDTISEEGYWDIIQEFLEDRQLIIVQDPISEEEHGDDDEAIEPFVNPFTKIMH
ncbi:hypothetical protein KAFR_0I02870 [Kazachstania africana CBS 2517]|uniref:Serine aminopeptidase S33 domain-containing protein n=1 Tax=Kazachstania africana (strain ATCC 22294 / BCRC 22015 / CBS 2517 / CECT 1963 / NBRC 1671 / NRRL Y-8276) TaxID=1071382 RepID=H2B0B6_KAZAF|nr:hypothetical protein KAFR_0I02870 [Kazachstania africana CBS 2517]CCF60066.1 hypothetical protein KAFR_0I02870 [Kazachstania africana CBS 2517]